MGQILVLLFLILLVFVIFGVLFGGSLGNNSAATRYPVREDHVSQLSAMFPDIQEAAIRFDLSKTGSLEITTENILTLGSSLPLPSSELAQQGQSPGLTGNIAGVSSPSILSSMGALNSPTQGDSTSPNGSILQNNPLQSGPNSTGASGSHAPQSLVDRLNLSEVDHTADLPEKPVFKWDTDPGKRAEYLRKQKEYMVLTARK
ncbi:hypothetical protein BB560_000234 [Smittium megazygosporum]|uniref:CUE domain-containing protein n=1 Tax=Smittium megazygosporum TaxID=133381 RepID=A0A2T9ZKY5_9FUNG|nr:hypothetical protein BB560_000234 [Smittium megazygosporum]